MVWTAQDDPTIVSVYKRCDEIPGEITGTGSEEE